MISAMDLFEAMDVSRVAFRQRLVAVTDAQWSLPTPCAGWTVRDLVNHVVGGLVRYTMLLHGASAADVDATRTVDHLRPAPPDAFDREAAAMGPAFREPGALARTVHHPRGDRSGEELLGMRVVEFTVHGWDLARATGGDEHLDDDVVRLLWGRLVATRAEWSGTTAFAAPEGSVPDDTPLQTRLLHLTGRRP